MPDFDVHHGKPSTSIAVAPTWTRITGVGSDRRVATGFYVDNQDSGLIFVNFGVYDGAITHKIGAVVLPPGFPGNLKQLPPVIIPSGWRYAVQLSATPPGTGPVLVFVGVCEHID